MAKITNVMIKDHNTLIINQEAKPGDEIDLLSINSVDTSILEIGPGIGPLTTELALRYNQVVALEIDHGLIPVLKYTLGEFNNVTVYNEDVMKADLDELLKPYFEKGKVSVCANLPYYITTPILMKLLECGLPFDYITIMIQSEVADRLCAKAGSSAYGAITAYEGNEGCSEGRQARIW